MAVLGILIFHSSELTGRVGLGVTGRAAETMGILGPPLFFVISGFLLYRPFVWARAGGRQVPSIARYARRRVLRIVPAYWTVLTLLAIFPGLPGVFSGDWWRYYGYLQIYSTRTVGGGIAVAWTLCVEITFYIAVPFWALAVRRIPARGGTPGLLGAELTPLVLTALGGVAVQIAAARQLVSYPVGISILGQCTWLCAGMALAVLSVAAQSERGRLEWLRRAGNRGSLCWLIAIGAFAGIAALVPGGGIFGLIGLAHDRQPVGSVLLRISLEVVAALFLVAPAAFGTGRDLPRRILAWRGLVWLGVISYSFYLWHLTVVEFIARRSFPQGFSARGLNLAAHVHSAVTAILLAAALIVTAVLATVSYNLVELPFLRRKEARASYPRAR